MLKIDLSQQITNYKRSCIVKIRDEWTTVNDLQNYIKQLFKFRKIDFTDNNNCWIPGTEPIDIIKTTNKPVELIGVGIKVRHTGIKVDTDINIINTQLEIKKYVRTRKSSVDNDAMHNIIEIEKSNRKRNISNISSIGDNPNIFKNNPNSLCESSTSMKKKRKRRKKTEMLKESIEDEQQDIDSSVNLNTKSPETELTKHHVRFDEIGNTISEGQNRQINFANFLDTLHPTKPRIFNAVVAPRNDNNEELKMKGYEKNDNKQIDEDNVIIKENIIINNGFELLRNAICQPQMDIINSNNQLQESCDVKSAEENSGKNGSNHDFEIIKSQKNIDEYIIDIFQHENKITNILSISDSLIAEPKVKDILFFKIFRLNDKYEPCLSDYICGKLENIIENKLKFYILAGQDELKDPQGKFSLQVETDDNKTDYLKIEFDELHNPRILKHEIMSP